MSTESNSIQSIATLLGGIDTSAGKLDGSSEAVKVRQLPLKDLPRYLAAYENEPACVELFCARPEGWSETLTRESFVHLLEEGEKLNLDFLSSYAARMQRRREKVLPNYEELMKKVMASVLPDTPPASPSKSA